MRIHKFLPKTCEYQRHLVAKWWSRSKVQKNNNNNYQTLSTGQVTSRSKILLEPNNLNVLKYRIWSHCVIVVVCHLVQISRCTEPFWVLPPCTKTLSAFSEQTHYFYGYIVVWFSLGTNGHTSNTRIYRVSTRVAQKTKSFKVPKSTLSTWIRLVLEGLCQILRSLWPPRTNRNEVKVYLVRHSNKTLDLEAVFYFSCF